MESLGSFEARLLTVRVGLFLRVVIVLAQQHSHFVVAVVLDSCGASIDSNKFSLKLSEFISNNSLFLLVVLASVVADAVAVRDVQNELVVSKQETNAAFAGRDDLHLVENVDELWRKEKS